MVSQFHFYIPGFNLIFGVSIFFQFLSRLRIRLNPNAQFGPKGTTLLHAAALLDEPKLVTAFGSCKFEPGFIDFQDRDGNTALHIAALENYPQVSF